MKNIYKRVFLEEESQQWGCPDFSIIEYILVSIIKEFEKYGFDQSQLHKLKILHSPTGMDYPMCSAVDDDRIIIVTTKDNYWAQLIYQFAHEYCHYLIDGPLDGELESGFWFEESLCELSSCFLLVQSCINWSKDNTLPKKLRLFIPHIADYFNNHMHSIVRIKKPLGAWIMENITILQDQQYHRDYYSSLAQSLLPVYISNPNLWKLLPYFKRLTFEEYHNFHYWVDKIVGPQIPDNLQVEFNQIKSKLLINNELIN